MIAVTVVGLLAALAIPAFVKARTASRIKLCIENLSQIESAKQRWGLEAGKSDGDLPVADDLIGAYKYMRLMPVCLDGGSYSFKPIGSRATCTIPGHSY